MVGEHAASFGRLLRQHRVAAGLTQEELADRAGIGVRTIAYLEAGRRGAPRSETVRLIAAALDLSVEEHGHFLARARSDDAVLPVSPIREAPAVSAGSDPPVPIGERRVWPVVGARLHPLIGRDAILAEFDRILEGQGPPVVLLAGEPGIGKTRLLREVAQRGVSAGWTVIPGGCHRQGSEEPYAPLLEALQQHLAGYDPASLQRVLAGGSWLIRLFPELADVLAPLPAQTIAPEHERRLMVAAITRLLGNVAGPAGTLLVLDDLQWAGQDTLELLLLLVRQARVPLRIVGAYRDTELARDSALRLMVGDLAQAGLVAHHSLDPLTQDDAAAVLTSLLTGVREVDAVVVGQVLERAGGIPYYLVSYAQALQLGGGDTVPWDLAAAVRQRVTLAAEAAVILGIAAVVGRRVPRWLLLAVSEQSGEEVVRGLERAHQARLLVEDGPDGYVFAHDVIREVVEADLGAGRRAALHGRIAAALDRADGQFAPEVLAYHYLRSDTPDRALVYLEQAGDEALAQYAYEQAERHYRDLLERLVDLRRDREAAPVREKLGELLRRVGRFADAHDVVTAAITWYQGVGDLEGAGRATALLGLVLDKQGASERARERLEGMVWQLGWRDGRTGAPSTAAARVWEQLATVYGGQGQYEEMLHAAECAAEIARALGDGTLQARAAERRGFALNCLGRLPEAREALEGAIPLLKTAGALPELFGALANLAENWRVAGDLTEALRLGERALESAARTGMDCAEMNQHLNQAEMLTAVGQWERARQHIARAEEIGRTREIPAYVATLLPYSRGELALREGHWDVAAEQFQCALTRAAKNNRIVGEMAHTLLAELDLMQGRPWDAQQRLTMLLERHEPNRMQILPLLAWTYLETGETERGLNLAQEAERETRERQMVVYLPEALRIQGKALNRLQKTDEACSVLLDGLGPRDPQSIQ